MTILLLVGVALVVFGAVVLLWFPDRPGGRIGWQGLEVSSLGAGLPLIALGVLAVGLASAGVGNGETRLGAGEPTGGATSGAGAADCFADVPAAELRTMEEGVADFILVEPHEPKAPPVWIRLTANGEPLGGLRYRFHAESDLFKIERIVDARCEPLEPVENLGRGGDPRTLQNADTVRLRLGDALYDLRLIASSDIRANFLRVAE